MDRFGIVYKREYECLKCYPGEAVCQVCVQGCQELHGEFVGRKAAMVFECCVGKEQDWKKNRVS